MSEYYIKVREFISALRYEEILVFEPGESEYERAVATSNLLYRYSRPDCVVQPKRTSQVQIIVSEARQKGLKITIKNGGHSFGGFSTAKQGILLDLLKMNAATPSTDWDNTEPKSITLQGGCLWGHAYKPLINKRKNGYVVNGGRCPTVGVSGFLLGGGLGPFSRSIGLGSDSVTEFTIVNYKGEVFTVKATDPVDSAEGMLFWALCGGGGGNFGVVVEIKTPIYKLSGTTVVAGVFTWTPKDEAVANFRSTMTKFYTTNWPSNGTIDTSWRQELKDPPAPFQVRFLVYHDGTEENFKKMIDENIDEEELCKRMKSRALPEESTRFLHETLVAQWSDEIVKAFPTKRKYSLYTSFIFKNNEATIKPIVTLIDKRMYKFKKEFPGETGLLQVSWIHSGNKTTEFKDNATAFPWREGVWFTYILLEWEDKHLERDMQRFQREMKAELRAYSLQGKAAYVNFGDPDFKNTDYGHAYHGANYERLQQVKEMWDPENVFDWDQGVKLPGTKITTQAKNEDETDKIAREDFAAFRPERLGAVSFPGLSEPAVGGLSGKPFPIGLSDLGFE